MLFAFLVLALGSLDVAEPYVTPTRTRPRDSLLYSNPSYESETTRDLSPDPPQSLPEGLLFDSKTRELLAHHAITDEQWVMMERMARSLVDWNTRINVVSRKDVMNVVSRHYVPSLSLLNLFASGSFSSTSTVLDLKAALKNRGLPVSGRKEELLARLREVEGDTCQTLRGATILDVGTGGGFPVCF